MTSTNNLFLANLPIKSHIFCILLNQNQHSDVGTTLCRAETSVKNGGIEYNTDVPKVWKEQVLDAQNKQPYINLCEKYYLNSQTKFKEVEITTLKLYELQIIANS